MNNKKNTGSRSQLFFRLLSAFFLLMGLLLAAYPLYARSLNDIFDQQMLEQYRKEQEGTLLERKGEYEQGTIQQSSLVSDPFQQEQKRAQLNRTLREHYIGSIDIPKLNVSIPIFDETNDQLLEKGASLLEGSSFPAGQVSAHTVLSAHRGLPERTLFTDLDQLKEGDVFVLTIANEKFAYEVNQTAIVEPHDTSLLDIQEGSDLVTLLTCTPYMINSHRLLVMGERTAYHEEVEEMLKESKARRERANLCNVLLVVSGVGCILVLMIRILRSYRRSRAG